MAKDPAFLFYSKDWLQGTAEMMPEEKGVYIDLLAHQHQTGSLPSEIKRLAKLVALPVSDFEPIWNNVLKDKFKPIDEANAQANAHRLANQKLSTVMGDRAKKGKQNAVIGAFGSVLRTSNYNVAQIKAIKQEFNYLDFIDVPSERLSERLTEWIAIRFNFLANANGNGNANSNTLTTNPVKENIKVRVANFVAHVNKKFDRKYQVTEKVIGRFNAAIVSGKYQTSEIIQVIENLKQSTYHIDTNYTYCTPEFCLRIDKIEMYKSGPIIQKTQKNDSDPQPPKADYSEQADYYHHQQSLGKVATTSD